MADKPEWVYPSSEQLKQVQELYDQSLYLQAYAVAERIGPLRRWRTPASRLLAGRLATNLGAPRMARAMHVLTWHKGYFPVFPYYVRIVAERRGLLRAWDLLEQHAQAIDQADPDTRTDCYGLRAWMLGWFRDFDPAEKWIRRAHEVQPGSCWTLVMESDLLERQDRYEEALEVLQRALALRPWYRPAIQSAAEVLERLGRDEEALTLLTEASGRVESMYVLAQLARLQLTLEQYSQARETLERSLSLAPLLEKGFAEGYSRIRSDLAYYCGDTARAVELLSGSKHPYLQKLANTLAASDPQARPVRLNVPFVQQHHVTCAPATLTSISQFWRRPADHLGIAEQICYDGTSNYSQRKWAESQGWVAREFTANWDDSVALLNRGLPFTLSTVAPGRAHLQAVVGYDPRRRTWWIRDPSYRHLVEIIADEIIEHSASHGPRAMVMVPADRAELLADLSLTDAPLYDLQYALNQCLERHDRQAAQRVYEQLCNQAPGHRMTRETRYLLARYDADPVAALRCIEQWRALVKEHKATLVLEKASILQELGRRQERLDVLREACADPEADPLLLMEYGRELLNDARQREEAGQYLHRAARLRPDQGRVLQAIGTLAWHDRDFGTGLRMYRWAACIDDKIERLAMSYFLAARAQNRTNEVLSWLRERFTRYGRRSSLPGQTLAWALDQLDQPHRGIEVLEEALRLRPDDGGLMLYAASMFGRFRNFERAAGLIAQARGHAPARECLEAAATLASYQGEMEESLARYRQVLELEPLSVDAHAAVARILLATEGMEAALRHLEQATQQFPHHCGLHQLWISWIRNEDPARTEAAVRHLIRLNPADVWAHRELALVLNRMNRIEEALHTADMAIQLDPTDPHSVALRGHIAEWSGRSEEARSYFRQALTLSVDLPAAIRGLLDLCHDAAGQREALEFIRQELVRQTTNGEGLVAWYQRARQILDPQELLTTLEDARHLRPDLPQTWSLVQQQLRHMGRLEEAHRIAREATESFPLVATAWQDLALVHQARGDMEGELAACEQLVALCPNAPYAAQHVAEVYQRLGGLDEAAAVLEKALRQQPFDSDGHALLAEVLWNKGDRAAAFERLRQSLKLDFDAINRWGLLRSWGEELERVDEVLALATELTQRHSDHPRVWLMLAEVLTQRDELERRLEAGERALALRPSLVDAHVVRIDTLTQLGRFEEALAACRPAAFDGQIPVEIRGQEAAVLAAQGRLEEAVAGLEETVARYPNYAWGISRLADWLEQMEEHARALPYAERLVQLRPDAAPAYGYRGQARLNCGDREGAIADFEHAIALDPRYHFATYQLFRLHMDGQDLEAAGRTLAHLRAHHQGAGSRVCEVEWHAAKGSGEALAIFRTMCTSADEDPNAVNRAAATLGGSNLRDQVRPLLESLLEEGSASLAAGALWFEQYGGSLSVAACEACLQRWLRQGEGGVGASHAYIAHLVNGGKYRRARRFIRRHAVLLHGPYVTWNLVGWAWVRMGYYREVLNWLEDWPQRKEAEADDLLHVALALRHLRRDGDARIVSEQAVAMPLTDETWRHHVWLAVDAVCEGDNARARQHLAPVPRNLEAGYYTFLRGLVEATLVVQEAPPADQTALRKARRLLVAAGRSMPRWRSYPDLGSAQQRCVLRIARHNGRWLTRLWAFLITGRF